jgi:hypothetical protein
MNLYRNLNIINRGAIDVFFAGRLVPSKRSEVAGVGRQKGLRASAWGLPRRLVRRSFNEDGSAVNLTSRWANQSRFVKILTSMRKLRQKSRRKSSSDSIEKLHNILKLLTYNE